MENIFSPVFRECTQPEGFFEGDNLENVKPKNGETPLAPFIANGEAPFAINGEAPFAINGEAPLASCISNGEALSAPFLTAELL